MAKLFRTIIMKFYVEIDNSEQRWFPLVDLTAQITRSVVKELCEFLIAIILFTLKSISPTFYVQLFCQYSINKNLQSQNVSRQKLHKTLSQEKNLLIKCWWNGHLLTNIICRFSALICSWYFWWNGCLYKMLIKLTTALCPIFLDESSPWENISTL